MDIDGRTILFMIPFIVGVILFGIAIYLTLIPMVSPTVIPNPSNIGYDWFTGIVRAITIALLYVGAFGFIALSVILTRRGEE